MYIHGTLSTLSKLGNFFPPRQLFSRISGQKHEPIYRNELHSNIENSCRIENQKIKSSRSFDAMEYAAKIGLFVEPSAFLPVYRVQFRHENWIKRLLLHLSIRHVCLIFDILWINPLIAVDSFSMFHGFLYFFNCRCKWDKNQIIQINFF